MPSPHRRQRSGCPSMSVAPGSAATAARSFPVDALLMSAGWTPSVQCSRSRAARCAWDEESRRFLPGTYAQDCASVGACNGTRRSAGDDRRGACGRRDWPPRRRAERNGASKRARHQGRDERLMGGRHERSGAGRRAGRHRQGLRRFPERRDGQGHPARRARGHALDRARQALHHNGMATDQGKTSNLHGLAIAAEKLGKRDARGRD